MNVKNFNDLLNEYIDSIQSLDYSPFTIRTNKYNLFNFVEWLESFHQVRTVDRLRKKHIHAWQRKLHEHRTDKGRPLKPRSINKKIEAIRCFLTFLYKRDYTVKDMTEELRYVKVPVMLPQSVLSHSQVRKTLAKIDISTPFGYRNRAMIELMYSCGLRAGEVVKLNVTDIDFEQATVRVQGKGRRERVAPIGKTAMRFLDSYIKAVRPFMLKDKHETALFLNNRGQRAPYHLILRIVHENTDKLNLGVNVTPHTFRRSCTSEMVRGNANIYHVKELLGHATMKHLQPYIKLNIVDLKKTHAKCHPREKDS